MSIRFDWRVWVILTIGLVGFILLVSEPAETLPANTLVIWMITVKGEGFALIAIAIGLAAIWKKDFNDNSDLLL